MVGGWRWISKYCQIFGDGGICYQSLWAQESFLLKYLFSNSLASNISSIHDYFCKYDFLRLINSSRWDNGFGSCAELKYRVLKQQMPSKGTTAEYRGFLIGHQAIKFFNKNINLNF